MCLFEPFKREGGLLTPFLKISTCRCPKGGINCKDWGSMVLKREGEREGVLCSLLQGVKWVLGILQVLVFIAFWGDVEGNL